MPPKKADKGPSKKTEAKKKEKVIEDKTFGLKNKKGGKNQKYIAQVEKQVKSGGNPIRRKDEELRMAEKKAKEDAKKREEEEKRLLNKVVVVQKVDQGVDPKSVFCAFFKQGLCKKGDKCKFSHDPSVEGKAAKRNLYADNRDEEENMDDWDEEKLEEVISKKHGSEKSNATDIICKHFLEAVENNKYGWFWSCPNGGDQCMYRHALPKGFVLKKDRKKEDKKDQISMEELVETKRAELSARSDLTPVTLETFVKWKRRKLREKAEKEKKEDSKKKDKAKSGQTSGLSGRELFSYNPAMVGEEGEEDEEGCAVDMTAREQEEDDGTKVHDIKFDAYGIMDDGVDESTDIQLAKLKSDTVQPSSSGKKDVILNGQAEASAVGGVAETGPIDEDLFDDEDLDELEEDLENLEV